MSMSKKDYVILAHIIRNGYKVADRREAEHVEDRNRGAFATLTIDKMVEDMANYFAEDNPSFDRKRFLTAATPEWHVKRGSAR